MSKGDLRTKYLLVGFSVTSWWAAKAILDLEKDAEIVALSEEEECYSRPLITYALGSKSKGVAYHGQVLKEVLNSVAVLWDTRAVKLWPEQKKVELSDGRNVNFDKAFIGVGGVPILPPIPGIDLPGVFTFTRKKDMELLRSYLKEFGLKKVLVMGGGFIGLKTCEALLEMGLELTLVELAPRLLSNMLDEEGSSYLEEALRNAGVKVIKENTVSEFRAVRNRLGEVVLQSGERLSEEVAIVAIGVRPNVDWLSGSGVEIDRGIVVDEFQMTSREDVYAGGDCAQTKNALTGEYGVVAIWPEAVAQGRVAGSNMAGKQVRYPGSIPMNSLEFGGMALVSAGLVNPRDARGFEILVRKEKGIYKKIVLKDDRVVGIVLVGDIEKAGLFVYMMREQIPVTDFKDQLLAENFGLVSLPKNYRKHMVEGAGIEV